LFKPAAQAVAFRLMTTLVSATTRLRWSDTERERLDRLGVLVVRTVQHFPELDAGGGVLQFGRRHPYSYM